METRLTQEQITAVVDTLPIQGRIMLRLLLLQYLDVTPEDIQYMASDRPDPRFQSGEKPKTPYISNETLEGITKRAAHYRQQIRLKRERAWHKIDCLGKQTALTDSLCTLAEQLLVSRFRLDGAAVEELKKGARTAIPRPAIRMLEHRWDKDEITEDDYRRERLCIEYQSLVRRGERERKRLDLAKRELEMVSLVPLQDHEICQIWGIPAGSLAARKVKYLHQYLQGVQGSLNAFQPATEQATTPPVDLWKETFLALSRQSVQRSAATYDGLEESEDRLQDKLTAFAIGTFPEESESRFWLSLTRDSRDNSEYGATPPSVFALQRLSAILNEMDTSPEALEHDLLARVSPTPKAATAQSIEQAKSADPQLGELGEHVLRSMIGEGHTDLQGRR
ncbi:MAG: hypothetical protein HY205_06500 [Nitrospirae bacterium]|nr:hypothetical protein [Nitrospirota bacterium]